MPATVITPAVVCDDDLAYGFFARLIDLFLPRERVTVEFVGPSCETGPALQNFCEIAPDGETNMIIEGPPGFCSATLAYLENTGGHLIVRHRYLLRDP